MPGKGLLAPHRLAYEVMKKQIEQDGINVVNNEQLAATQKKKNIRAAQSYLWSEIPLTPGSSTYQFNVKNGVPNIGNAGIVPGEIRLKDQDVFFTYALGFYLRVLVSGSNQTNWQNFLFTFPSAVFGGLTPGPAVWNQEALTGLWTEGALSVKTNGEDLTPRWDMGQHLYIPQTQAPVAVPFPTQSYLNWFDEVDLSENGLVVTEPNWIINGGNDNNYTVTYPQNYGSFAVPDPLTTNWRISLVMKWQGFLAQNASSIMNNQPAKI